MITTFFGLGNKNEVELEQLKINNKNLSDQYMDSLKVIKAKENSLAELVRSNDALNKQNRSQQEQIMSCNEQIEFLTAQTKSLETEVENLKLLLKKEVENQQDWQTKFQNLTSAFNKNQDELLAARNDRANLQNFKHFLEKQHDEAVQLYSKQKTEEVQRVENELSKQKIEDVQRVENEFKSKIENLETSVKQITEDLKQKEEITQKQQSEITNQLNNLKALQQQIKTLISQNKEETEKIVADHKSKNKEMKKEKKKLEEQISDLQQELKTKIKELNEKAETLNSKYKKYKNKYENSKNELLGLQDLKSHFLPPEEQSPKKFQTIPIYDMIINIDSLKTQKLGWEITINEKTKNLLKEISDCSLVGFVGREKIGKTYLLNKLCEFDLPSGTNTNTRGLSLKYHKELNMLCLDSAGFQAPVYYFEDKNLKRFNIDKESLKKNNEVQREMINDRTLTDIFIQDFILDVCDVIVIMVGQLSQNDQKFIERIVWKYQAKKKIIVVHNFANLYQISDVENKIQMDIIKAFDTTPRLISNTDVNEYIEKSDKKNCTNISHLVLGVDWSESGKNYNNGTIKYLRDIIETTTERKSFDVIAKLQEFFAENYRLYLKFKKRPSKQVFLEFNKNDCALRIRTDEEFEVSNPIFNSFGSLVTNPPYEVFEQKGIYIVLIELPDLKLETVKMDIDNKKNEFNCLRVVGEKNYSDLGDSEKNNGIMGNRMCGEFKCVIPLGPKNYKAFLKNNKSLKYENGILKVEVEYLEEEDQEI